ncbi:hypothetical protein SAMD00019534_017690, partial [Acytostelium subglobosum LB1]
DIIRCIRYHISDFIKLKDRDLIKAQLGLGHSYSRSKVKFNVHKVDNMIIQAICTLEQIDKDLNTYHMRVREWYSWHFPEMIKIVKENIHFARLIKLIQNKTDIKESMVEDIAKIVDDESLAKDIYNAAKASMGTDISTIDLESILSFADRVISMHEYRESLEQYLTKKMRDIAPNLQALIGDRVGAKLISRAGSLTNLAKYPASTIQILGAEKALFRAMKVRGKTPKYGIIYNSSFISKATPKNKGRISRCLANKVASATRIDCFSETPTDKFGLSLKKQVEDRLEFFNTGVSPKRNLDVMREVIKEVEKDFGIGSASTTPSKKRSLDDSKSEKSSKKTKKESKKEESDEEIEEEKPKESKKSSKKAEPKKEETKKSSSKKAAVESEESEEEKETKKSSKKESSKRKERDEDAMEVDEKPAAKSEKKSKKAVEEPKKEEKSTKKSSSKKEETKEETKKSSSKKADKEEEEKKPKKSKK